MILQLKIKLLNVSKPPVWRRVLVPSHASLDDLHRVIQESMGWYDEHLYNFYIATRRGRPEVFFELPSEDDLDLGFVQKVDSRSVSLEEVFKSRDKLCYEYDFGDGWEHSIVLEATSEGMVAHASCIGGRGACPPEDCCGPWGYEFAKEAIESEDEEERDMARFRLCLQGDDEVWDAKEFDLKQADSDTQSVIIIGVIPGIEQS